jgi:hypothetical protein
MGDALNPQAVASGNRLVSMVGHVRGLGHECLANELERVVAIMIQDSHWL